MKNILFTVSLLFSLSLFSQENINIISFETVEKNIKELKFLQSNQIKGYVITASNQTTRDYAGCRWESSLSKDEMQLFINDLQLFRDSDQKQIKNKKRVVKKLKHERVKVKFNNTRCNTEHKTHYFQKTCNRSLSFVLSLQQISELINIMEDVLHQEISANK